MRTIETAGMKPAGDISERLSEEPEKSKPRIFVASDMHFDHANIIDYCKRPFRDAEEMNKVLLDNWNSTVCENDRTYFLGDMSYGRKSRPAEYWEERLNGEILFIKGNHDHSKNISFYDSFMINYQDIVFYLCHDPKEIPANWEGWSLYGHVHNNHPEKHPFFDKDNRRVNVSVELTDYRPIMLDDIVRRIKGEDTSF